MIKIIAEPTGEAPPAIKMAWLGLSMPSRGIVSDGRELFTPIKGLPGYAVDYDVAILCLENNGEKTAAEWWRNYCRNHGAIKEFIFNAESCRAIGFSSEKENN